MSISQKTHDVDLEAANFNDSSAGDAVNRGGAGVSAAGGGGGGAPPLSSDVKGIDENNGSKIEITDSNASECSVVIVDLESGLLPSETKVCLGKIEIRDCRICHLSLDVVGNQDSSSGAPIELGCACKDDLAAAHKQCAEAWFKIKGNKTCEICGSIAQNIACATEAALEEQSNEANDASATSAAPVLVLDSRNFWQGHRFLNFLLACVVFAFILSWLFHFNVPS